jgi:cell fate regulator YaaT (PSP1 superfamily)
VPKIVSVVFGDGGKVYHFDPGVLELAAGDQVVVETTRGTDFGRVVEGVRELSEGESRQGMRRVVRAARTADLERVAENCAREREVVLLTRELAAKARLTMKVVAAESTFDGNRLTVSFSAEDRVDFRPLVSQLSERMGRRVELRQVSSRDEARLIGGYGPCGRRLCCASFCGDQDPVSIRMAKDQNLPLNPSKISGCCGRLMCCLKYEHGVYTSFKQRAPRRGALVTTPSGRGKVTELLAPADSVSVDLGEGRMCTCRLAELVSDSAPAAAQAPAAAVQATAVVAEAPPAAAAPAEAAPADDVAPAAPADTPAAVGEAPVADTPAAVSESPMADAPASANDMQAAATQAGEAPAADTQAGDTAAKEDA